MLSTHLERYYSHLKLCCFYCKTSVLDEPDADVTKKNPFDEDDDDDGGGGASDEDFIEGDDDLMGAP